MKKVIVAIDSFKGCLTSKEAGDAVVEGIKNVLPECDVLCFPVADGGEGLVDALVEVTGGSYRELSVHDPLMRPVDASYGLSGDGHTVFIEMAAASGLPLLTDSERNPMLTTTYGTGELIRDALNRGGRNFIIGIGGSATNDAGLGMLHALGYCFYDEAGRLLEGSGSSLGKVVTIDSSSAHPALKESRFTVACDVDNPFYGEEGAVRVFAGQKGADEKMKEELEAGMRTFSRLIQATTGKDIADVPGAGAAGGLGGTLLAFLNAVLKPGINLLLQTLDFATLIKGADLIITGEGKADRQSVMGKVPSGILEEARQQGIPVVLIAGCVEDADILNQAGFQGVFPIVPAPIPFEIAIQPHVAAQNIRRTVVQIVSVAAAFCTGHNTKYSK